MDSSPPSSGPRRGVWSFVKRNVFGDVQSHPVSLSGSTTPEEALPETATDTRAQAFEGVEPQSPFQSRSQEMPSDQEQDIWFGDQPSQSSRSTRVTMESEPSLRYGLAEGMYSLALL